MKHRFFISAWMLTAAALVLFGSLGPALASDRDTTKIKQCIQNSDTPQFITCRDAKFLER